MRLIATKEESQFKHPLPKQWLRPYLFGLDDLFYGRWEYWTETIAAGKPLDAPIPKFDFDGHPHAETVKNIKDCINFMSRKGHGPRDAWMAFIDWLLWGFGTKIVNEYPEKVSEDISWHWYKTFDLSLWLIHPTDHMAWGSCEIAGMAHSGNGNGYFPTPGNVVHMMSQMTMTEADKTKTVMDCCLGTGTMLLYASNYSLRLFGQDICLDMVKMATVNAWVYIPWLACSAENLIDWNKPEDYQRVADACRKWKEEQTVVPMITHRPRSNTLGDWV